jgi:two-component system, NarL family, sensor histidine kinase DesK
VTNVVRHSGATECWIVVGPDWAEVRDNGPRAQAPAAPVPEATAGDGSGLRGLRQRVKLAGGVLDAGPQAEGGFRVRASLPVFGAPTAAPQNADVAAR